MTYVIYEGKLTDEIREQITKGSVGPSGRALKNAAFVGFMYTEGEAKDTYRLGEIDSFLDVIGENELRLIVNSNSQDMSFEFSKDDRAYNVTFQPMTKGDLNKLKSSIKDKTFSESVEKIKETITPFILSGLTIEKNENIYSIA